MIKIAHLYYDLLNLYGEQGNILALRNSFKNQNIDIQIDKLTINDKIDFKKYDLIYIGSGSDNNLYIALEDLKKHTKDIKKFIEDNKYLISTGNSYLLFGKYIEKEHKKFEGLNIFEYYAKEHEKQFVSHSFMKYLELSPIIGFQNRKYLVQNNNNHLFTVLDGNADNFKSSFEGFHYKNFFGTYLIGPLLIRNPHFTDLIVEDICKKHKYKYHIDLNTYEYKAYNEYLKNFYEMK